MEKLHKIRLNNMRGMRFFLLILYKTGIVFAVVLI